MLRTVRFALDATQRTTAVKPASEKTGRCTSNFARKSGKSFKRFTFIGT